MHYIKKYTALILIISLISIFSFQPIISAADVIPIKKISEVEDIVYGKASSVSIIERINSLEKTLYGEKKDGSLVERAENIADYVLSQGSRPSISFVLNSLEWTLTDDIKQGNIVDRLNDLETKVFGKPESGPLTTRIKRLANMSFPGGKISGESVVIESNTEIKLKLIEKIDSSATQKGELIPFEIAEDIVVDGKLVIPAGAKSKMRVTEIEKAGKFGKPGEVKVEFLPLRAIDGTVVKLIRDEELMTKRSRQLALGAGVLGAIVFNSPLGFALSYFVKGSPDVYDAGSKITVLTTEESKIFALNIK